MSTNVEVVPVIQFYADISGKALDDGFVYIGTSGLDPVANPISVFWDEALTITAPNPVRTRNGHPDRAGAPSRFFVNADSYSFAVKNKNGTTINSALDSLSASDIERRLRNNTDPTKGAGMVGWGRDNLDTTINTTQRKLDSEPVSIWEFAHLATGYVAGGNPALWSWAPAISAALATGRDVEITAGFIYSVSAEIAIGNSGQRIIGKGLPTITQTTANLGIFTANAKTDLAVEGIKFVASSGSTTTYNGSAIRFENCSRLSIKENLFTNHSASAVFLRSCNDSEVAFNEFSSSLGGEFSGDITMWNQCNRNVVAYNSCKSGADQAITLQTIADADVADDNIIHGNIVQDNTRYGIIAYNSRESKTGNMRRTRITQNAIKNIIGSTINLSTGTKTYGNGIYTLSCEDLLVSGNTVNSTNLQTTDDVLAPAAIGLNEISSAVVSGNIVSECLWDGIRISDVGQRGDGTGSGGAGFIPRGFVLVGTNTLHNITREGIHVKNKHSTQVTNNGVYSCGRNGILTSTDSVLYPTLNHISIRGNDVRGSTLIGVALNKLVNPVVSGNKISENTGDGLFLDTTNATISDNEISGNSDGIDVRATGSGTLISGNVVSGNAVLGIRGEHEYRDEANIVTGNTGGDYGGTFGIVRTLANAATPSVQNGKMFNTGGTTTITDFTNGYVGQVIYIRSGHTVTITHNASVIRLNANANFNMTSGDTLTLIKTGTATWDEVGRMDR